MWNTGACPIEPTTSPDYPNNTTLNRSYPDEIYLAITAPNNTQTVLIPVNRYVSGGGAANYNNVALEFRDSAAGVIPNESAPASGAFRPMTAFSVYNGTNPQGTWTLTFGDNYSEDPLRIVNWRVRIDYDLPPTVAIGKISDGGTGTFTFTETNLETNPAPITTVTAGTPVTGTAVQVTTPGAAVTVTEAPAAGFIANNGSGGCTDLNSAVTGQTGSFGSISNSVLSVPAANVVMNAMLRCTFTNTAIRADLQIVKSANPGSARTGDVVTYTLTVSNAGPNAANGAVLRDAPGVGLDCTTPSSTATCTAGGGANCPGATVSVASLTSTAGVAIPVLPAGGGVVVTMQCTVTASGLP